MSSTCFWRGGEHGPDVPAPALHLRHHPQALPARARRDDRAAFAARRRGGAGNRLRHRTQSRPCRAHLSHGPRLRLRRIGGDADDRREHRSTAAGLARARRDRCGRRDVFRSRGSLRPPRVRPRFHILCPVDDFRLGETCWARRSSCLAPGGSLHVVDFGQQRKLPGWFRPLLFGWLDLFHVAPRADLERELRFLAQRNGLHLDYRELYRGYADYAVLTA